MAGLFGAFAKGFADQATANINAAQKANYDEQASLRKQQLEDAYKKDNMYLENTMKLNMQQIMEKTRDADLSARQEAAEASKAKAKEQAITNHQKALGIQVRGATSSDFNSASQMDSQVGNAMGTSTSQTANNNASPVSAITGQSGIAQSNTPAVPPVTGSVANGAQDTSNGALPGTEQAATMPNASVGQVAQAGMIPPPTTASTPAPFANTVSGEQPHVQNPLINNSAINATNNPAKTEPSFEDKILASQGIELPEDEKQRVLNATSPLQILTPEDGRAYAALDLEDPKGARDFLKGNPKVIAWNVAKGRLPDGTFVAPINDSKFSQDPLSLRNPMVNIRAMVSDKTQLDKEQDRRNQELDPSNPKSGQSVLINTPRQQASQALVALNSQEAINSFVNSGSAAKDKQVLSKLFTSVTGENTDIASSNDLMQHFEAYMQRDMFSNTKGRVTNQEFNTFKNMITNSGQTPQGRQTIINFMKGVSARQLEVANAYESYKNANAGTFKGADDIINKYVNDNPVVSLTHYNPANPSSMLNPMAKSFENWQLERTNKANSTPDHTGTIDAITQQIRPDSLKMAMYSQSPQGTAPTGRKVGNTASSSNTSPDLQKQTNDLLDHALR